MPIPDYQTVMLPLLRITADVAEHTLADTAEKVAEHFKLSEAERTEMLPSGTQLKLFSRVGWARTYLTKAGLLEKVSRGKFKITDRGVALLKSSPEKIDLGVLNRYPEFLEFIAKARANKPDAIEEVEREPTSTQQPPLEMLENSYQALHNQLAEELSEKILKASPRFFEKLVVDLLVKMGYGGSRSDAGQAIGRSGDDGIDGIIKEDRLGLESVYVQAKRWKGTVGRPDVQSFAGSLEGHRARKGVFITTSQFSAEAKDYVKRIEKRIILIEGQQLADLSIEFGIGVEPLNTYKIQRIDTDYFEEE
jgi:restriction system protein